MRRLTLGSLLLPIGASVLSAHAAPVPPVLAQAAQISHNIAPSLPVEHLGSGFPSLPPVGRTAARVFAAGDPKAKFDHFFSAGPHATEARRGAVAELIDHVEHNSVVVWEEAGETRLTEAGAYLLNEGLLLGRF